MVYIETSLLYFTIVIAVFIIIAVFLNTFIWILARIYPLYKKKWFLSLFLRKFSLKKKKDIEVENIEDLLLKDEKYSDSFKGIFRANFMTFFTLIYFISFTYSFVSQSVSNFGNDRAYPQAKAYSMVGNLVQLYHMVFFANPKFNLAENDFDKQFMKVFDYVLENMYQYIPKDDAERDYWLYRYKYAYIAKTRYTPVTEEFSKKHFSLRFFISEAEAAAYEPRFITMLDEMHRISKVMMYGKMKDKVLNDGKRYIPIAQMSYYLTYKMILYVSLESMSYDEKIRLLYEDEKLFAKYMNYNRLLIELGEKVNNKNIKNAFDNVPFSYALLYYSILLSSNNIVNKETIIDNKYPCVSKDLDNYISFTKLFFEWVNHSSSFIDMSKNAKENAKRLLNSGTSGYYYISKYVCDIEINYSNRDEKYALETLQKDETVKDRMLETLNFERYQVEKIYKMKEKYNKGE